MGLEKNYIGETAHAKFEIFCEVKAVGKHSDNEATTCNYSSFRK